MFGFDILDIFNKKSHANRKFDMVELYFFFIFIF